MAKQPRHASKGLLILGAHDVSTMTSAAGQNNSRHYVGAPAFQKDDVEGIPGPRSSQLEVSGYFVKRELGEVEAILQRAVGEAASNLLTLYAPYGPAGTSSIGEACWIQNTHQILTEEGGNIGGIVMLGQTYVGNGGARLAKMLHVHTGVTVVGTPEVQTLVYDEAPLVQEFALQALGADELFVFTPATSNGDLKAGIEGLPQFSGFTVTVAGNLTGTDLKSGTLTLTFAGNGNVPQLKVLSSESQRLTLGAAAATGTWGTAGVTVGDSEATVQTALRALGGLQQQVVVKGSSDAGGDVTVSGAGDAEWNGVYTPSGTFNGGVRYTLDATHWLVFAMAGQWVLNPNNDGSGTDAYQSAGSAGTVPTGGWIVNAGAGPAPTLAIDPASGSYTAYWPYSIGNRSQLAVTGTGFTGSTVTEGGDDADTLIVEATTTAGETSRTLTVRSASFNGTSVDFGKNRTLGCRAQAHFVYASGVGKTVTVKIQHSADNATWVDLLSFDAQTTTGSQSKTLARPTAVNRYVRAVVAGGAITGDWAFTVAFSPWA